MSQTVLPKTPFVVVRDDGPGLSALRGAVIGIGNFDGVHRGHRAVIGATLDPPVGSADRRRP